MAEPAGLTIAPSFPSAADTGDNLIDLPFQVDFGDKNAGSPGAQGSAFFQGLIKDAVVGIAVALVAKYLWEQVK